MNNLKENKGLLMLGLVFLGIISGLIIGLGTSYFIKGDVVEVPESDNFSISDVTYGDVVLKTDYSQRKANLGLETKDVGTGSISKEEFLGKYQENYNNFTCLDVEINEDIKNLEDCYYLFEKMVLNYGSNDVYNGKDIKVLKEELLHLINQNKELINNTDATDNEVKKALGMLLVVEENKEQFVNKLYELALTTKTFEEKDVELQELVETYKIRSTYGDSVKALTFVKNKW